MKYRNVVFTWQEMDDEVSRYWSLNSYDRVENDILSEEHFTLIDFKIKNPACKTALEFLKAIILLHNNLENRQIRDWVINNKWLFKKTKNFRAKYLDHNQQDEYPFIKLKESMCFVDTLEFDDLINFIELYGQLFYGQKHFPPELRKKHRMNLMLYYNLVFELGNFGPDAELNWYKERLGIDL